MKFKVIMGWILLLSGLSYGIYRSKPLLDQLAHNPTATYFFILLILLLFLAVARVLRY